MKIIYERIGENIIRKVTTTVVEIDLQELKKEIDDLNERIETTPALIEMPSDKELLLIERDEKVKNLEELKKVK